MPLAEEKLNVIINAFVSHYDVNVTLTCQDGVKMNIYTINQC